MNAPVQRLASLWAAALLLAALALAEDDSPYALSIPLEIEINGASRGDILVRASASLDRIALEGASLKEILRERAAEALQPLVASLPDDYAPLEDLLAAGLEVSFNLERLVVEISIQEISQQASVGPRSIRLVRGGHAFERETIAEARFSGYVNARVRSEYIESGAALADASRLRTSVSLDHVFNVSGWAFEGQSSIRDRGAQGASPFVLHDIRVVKDFPERAWRLALGDVATPISRFQQGFPLFGASLSREFGIQPSRIFTPTGSASFQLQENSQVDIYLNGGLRQTLDLERGEYGIEEFKLLAGANNLDVRIRGESGREDSINVTRYSASEMLGRGVSNSAISLGLPPADASTVDTFDFSLGSFYERSLDATPLVSAFYARGLTDSLTAEANAQGRSGWARASLAATWSNELGDFFAGGSANAIRGAPMGSSAQVAWRREVLGARVRADATYSSVDFARTRPGQAIGDDSVKFNTSLGIARRCGERWDLSLTGYHQLRHDERIDYAVTTQVGRRFGDLHATLGVKLRRQREKDESAVFVRLSWSPRPNWTARAQFGAGDSGTYSGNQVALNYSERRARSYVGSSLRAQSNGPQSSVFGDFHYQTELYDVTVARDQVFASLADYDASSSRYSLSASSAIAFADGAFGFARRVRDSFAIVDSHPKWRGTALGINPGLGGYQRQSDGRGPRPVLGDLNSYRPSLAVVHTIDSDLFLDDNEFLFEPSYRRGTKLVIGTDSIYTLRGALVDSFGDPWALKNLALTRDDGAQTNAFTNKAGRFIVSGLGEGHWTISVVGSTESAQVEIGGEETFVFLERIETR